MDKAFDAMKLADKVSTDMNLHDDLIAQGQELYSPHPSKKGFLVKQTKSGREIGVLVNGKFTVVDESL